MNASVYCAVQAQGGAEERTYSIGTRYQNVAEAEEPSYLIPRLYAARRWPSCHIASLIYIALANAFLGGLF